MIDVLIDDLKYWTVHNWLVVSTHLKNISQIGSFPQVGVKIKNIWNHHLDNICKDLGAERNSRRISDGFR